MAKLQIFEKYTHSTLGALNIFKVTDDDDAQVDDFIINEDLVLISVASSIDMIELGIDAPVEPGLFRCSTVSILTNTRDEMNRVTERLVSDVAKNMSQQRNIIPEFEEVVIQDDWYLASQGEPVTIPIPSNPTVPVDFNVFVVRGMRTDPTSSSSSG